MPGTKVLFCLFSKWNSLICVVWLAITTQPIVAQSIKSLVESAPIAESDVALNQSSAPETQVQKQPVPMRPPIKLIRYEEDWRALRNPASRTGPFDRLKYIPLRNRDDWYLSIGGEVREYYEFFNNENWGTFKNDDDGWLQQRYVLHTDWHLGQRVRVFGQLFSGVEIGRVGGPRPPDEDLLDLHQLFVDVTLAVNPNRKVTLRLGRQEVGFGSQRLISVREGPTVRQTFDGARLSWQEKKWTMDGFFVKPVRTSQGIFDDSAESQRSLWGLYAVRPLPLLTKKGHVDLYYLGLDRKDARFFQGPGREIRHTFGTRIWSQREALDYNFEFVGQVGTYETPTRGKGSIRAWTAASDTGYTFEGTLFKPRIGFRANVTSGDRDPNNPDLQTFNALFPRGAYFGQISPIGPYNHIDIHPSLDLKFGKSVQLTSEVLFFWRQSLGDGVYGIPGNVLRPGTLSRERFLGTQPGIQATWTINPYTSVSTNYARFLTGEFFNQTPPGKDIDYFSVWWTFKF